MMKFFIAFLLAAFASLSSAQDVKVVYHVNTGVESATAVLNNIQNHLNAGINVINHLYILG